MNVQGISQAQGIQETEDRDDIPGGEPNYIPNTDEPTDDGMETSDTASIDSTSDSSSSSEVETTTGALTNEEAENYVENTNEYEEETTTNEDNPPQLYHPAQNEGNSTNQTSEPTSYECDLNVDDHGTSDGINTAEDIVNDLYSDMNPWDYMSMTSYQNVAGGYIGGGYQIVDGERLGRILMLINLLTNLELGIHMVADAQMELTEKILEIVLELTKDENDAPTDKAQLFKSLKERLKLFVQFVISVYKAAYTHNAQKHQLAMQTYERMKGGGQWYDKVANWFTGDRDARFEKRKFYETQIFNQVQSQNLQSLNQALRMLAASYANSGRAELEALGNTLEEFADESERLDRVMTYNSSVTNDWHYWSDLDYFEATNVFQDILSDIRSKMVAADNLYQAMLFMQTAQQDLSDSVRETILEISSHSSKAEYAYVSHEGFSKTASLLFDTTFNTLMSRVHYFNQTIRIAKNIRKLKEGRAKRIASRVFTAGAIALVAVACLIGAFYSGGASIAAGIGLIGAILGALGGALGAWSAKHAQSMVSDSYDPASADFTFDLLTHRKKTGKAVTNALNEADRQEEILAQSMANVNFLEKVDDGFYALNVKALASFEIRQQHLHNFKKIITLLAKAQRDLSRTITAIALEKAIRDHGEGYLLQNLERTIHHRSLITNAIKFQLQQIVQARNIARQNQLMVKNAFWDAMSPIIGAVCSAPLAFIPGVGWGLAIAIGSAVGAGINQLVKAYAGDSGYDMNLQMESQEFERVLENRRENRASGTPEDRLYELEDQLYAQLLNNGLVGTGDGYQNVNFVLVGKIYNQLMKIQLLRQALETLRAAQAKISAAIRQQVVGVGSSFTELGQVSSRAGLQQSMVIVSSLTRFLQERASVLNRARTAEKARTNAWVSFSVNTALSAAGVGTAAAAGANTAISSLANSLTPAAMSLFNAVYTMATSIVAAQEGLGAYEHFDSEKAVKQIRGDKLKDDNVYAKLSALEEQVYLEAGRNLARTMDGANMIMDGQVTGILSQRMNSVNNLRKMLLILISSKDQLSRAVRSKVGIATSAVEDFSDIASTREQFSKSIMNSLIEAVNVVIERDNQISNAQRQALVSGLSALMSIASIAMTAVSAYSQGKAQELKQEIEASEKEISNAAKAANAGAEAISSSDASEGTSDSQDAETGVGAAGEGVTANTGADANSGQIDTSQQPEAKAAKLEQGKPKINPKKAAGSVSNDRPEVDPNANAKGQTAVESKAPHQTKLSDKYMKLVKTARKYAIPAAALNLTATFLNYYSGRAFDWDRNGKKAQIKSSALDLKQTRKTDGRLATKQMALEESSSERGIFASMDSLETDTILSEIMMSDASTPVATDIILQRIDQQIRTFMNGIKQACGLTQTVADYTRSEGAAYGDVNKFNEPKAVPTKINFNNSSPKAIAKLLVTEPRDPERAEKFIVSLPQKVKSGEIKKTIAVLILKNLEQLKPELKSLIDKVLPQIESVAAGASVQPKQVQKPQPPAEALKVEPKQQSSTKGAREYAKKLIVEFQEKNEQLAKMMEQVAQLDTQAKEIVENTTLIQGTSTEIGTEGSQQADTPEKQLQALGAKREQIMKKLDELVQQLKTLHEELPKLKGQISKVMSQVKARLVEINTKLTSPGLTTKDQQELLAEKAMLQQAEGTLQKELNVFKQKIEQVKQEIAKVRGQLKGIQAQIAKVTRKIEKERKAEQKKMAAKGAGEAKAGNGETIQKVASLGFGYQRSKQDTYREKALAAQEAEQKLAELVSTGSSIGGLS